MLSKVFAPAHLGLQSHLVEVECDITNGLPALIIVGLPDKAIEEAKERVRSAIKNSGLVLPPKRITLNLAPADIPKDGTAYDLAMAVAILAASGQIEANLSGALFCGELALDGQVRAIKGALAGVQLAQEAGLAQIYLPQANQDEAALISGLQLYPLTQLRGLYRHLVGEQPLAPYSPPKVQLKPPPPAVDLADIYGQQQAKRALEIAAAGAHNIFFAGPPGSGKTLLAKALPGLLPQLSLPEMIEITKLYSLAGINNGGIITERPFRSPHHTASHVALIGGGRWPRPGEISLSHYGVLFLDELPEFPRSTLEVLRQPLEDRQVTVARAATTVTFPAHFLFIATQNPCPCGYAGDPVRDCSCSLSQVQKYQRKISGPLLDRIDLVVNVPRVKQESLLESQAGESSATVANRVLEARDKQLERFGEQAKTNAAMTNGDIEQHCQLRAGAQELAKQALISLGLSARSYMRLLKVSRTIADLAVSAEIEETHLAEALQYRARA